VVAHVVLVVDLAVEELDAQRDALPFGVRSDLAEGPGAVLEPLRVRHPPAVSREADEVGDLRLGREVDALREGVEDRPVVLDTVQAFLDRDRAPERAERAHEAVLPDDGPVLRLEEVDALVADPRGVAAQLVERHLAEAPA
jgi:hypothetical protein